MCFDLFVPAPLIIDTFISHILCESVTTFVQIYNDTLMHMQTNTYRLLRIYITVVALLSGPPHQRPPGICGRIRCALTVGPEEQVPPLQRPPAL